MKRTKLSYLCVILWVKMAAFLFITSILPIDRTLAGETRSRTRLPSPPSVRKPASRSIDKKPAVSPSPRLREYVFQAPRSVRPATVTNSRPLPSKPATRATAARTRPLPSKPPTRETAARTRPMDRSNSPRRVIVSDRLFRVRVSTTSADALARIQKIEPFAFIHRDENAIQAGIFQQRQQADRRVRELASIGFSARIVTLERH